MLPNTSPLWTAVAYAAFDISTNVKQGKDAKKKQVFCNILYDDWYSTYSGMLTFTPIQQPKGDSEGDGDLKPVKEVEIKHSDREPKNESGCILS